MPMIMILIPTASNMSKSRFCKTLMDVSFTLRERGKIVGLKFQDKKNYHKYRIPPCTSNEFSLKGYIPCVKLLDLDFDLPVWGDERLILQIHHFCQIFIDTILTNKTGKAIWRYVNNHLLKWWTETSKKTLSKKVKPGNNKSRKFIYKSWFWTFQNSGIIK